MQQNFFIIKKVKTANLGLCFVIHTIYFDYDREYCWQLYAFFLSGES
jgi:hypothetical protein